MKRKIAFSFVCLLSLIFVDQSYGQAQQPSVVQLPTFNFFTVSTTVSAPDSGGAYLGGIRRNREGRVSRGVPGLSKVPFLSRLGKNVAIGKETGSSSLSLHPRIIDLTEMDEAVLARAAARRRALSPDEALVMTKAGKISDDLAATNAGEPGLRMSSSGGAPSVAAIRRHHALAAQKKNDELSRLLAKAESLEAQGKKSVAKIYYNMALRRSKGELAKQIALRIEALKGPRVASN